jgi:CheY-like chemotaxis protein
MEPKDVDAGQGYLTAGGHGSPILIQPGPGQKRNLTDGFLCHSDPLPLHLWRGCRPPTLARLGQTLMTVSLEKVTLPGQAPPRGCENILVVEDEPVLRRTVGQILQMLGYKVFCVENGLEALEFYWDQSEEIDLILSDIAMPEMGGLELRKELDEEGASVPVLLTSGLCITQLQLLEGWDSSRPFLEKPWDLETLAQLVRRLLDQAPSRA